MMPVVGGERVESLEYGGIESTIERGDRLRELIRMAGTDDRGCDGRLGEAPCDRELGKAHSGVGRHRPQRVDGGEVSLVPISILIVLRCGTEGESRSFGRRARSVLAGQES